MTALALVALWFLLSIMGGLLIGRGIIALRAVESDSCTSPPVKDAGKPAADCGLGAAPRGRPLLVPTAQRREYVDENSA